MPTRHDNPTQNSGLMGIEDAARYMCCSVTTMRWLRRTRQVLFIKLGGKLMVRRQNLDKWIEQQEKN